MRLVCGIGFNDLDYIVQIRSNREDGKRKLDWVCPYYQVWGSMLNRCFGEKFKQERQSYKDVACIEDWLYASKFKAWMEQQDWEGKQLDKDIIVPNNKVYSPETCAFVLGATNSFVTDRGALRGEWPIGVHHKNKGQKFGASCRNPFTKKKEHLGYFNCPQEAHETWRKRKHQLAQLVAATETDPRVVEALKKRYSCEEWYKHNPI